MGKYQTIYENIEDATRNEVVKKNKVSMIAILLILVSCFIFVSGYYVSDPNSPWATLLYTTGILVFIGSIVKLMMGNKAYLFQPTGSQLEKYTIYFDPQESQTLQYCLESKRLAELQRLKRRTDTGVKVDAMISKDSKFAAVQVSEYIPYNYEPVSPVMCYYNEEAQELASNLK